jgi:enoyl-[acyl-carrier protein] reductase I
LVISFTIYKSALNKIQKKMLLKNKRILISGLANKYSIAAGIASAMHREGAELAFTYQNERLLKNLAPLAEEFGSNILIECDVSSDESIDKSFVELNKHWDKFDGFVHSIGYAPADQLEGNFVDVTTREGFKIAHDISSYSFTALAKAAKPFLNDGSALLTLTYLGSMQTMPNYNVMGLAKASLEANTRFLAASMGSDNVRVNAISAGPIKTLAASGVKNFRKMLSQHSARAPLGRTVTTEEVGNVAAFLCSDYASGITGEITYVDAGFNIAAMPLYEEVED